MPKELAGPAGKLPSKELGDAPAFFLMFTENVRGRETEGKTAKKKKKEPRQGFEIEFEDCQPHHLHWSSMARSHFLH